MVKQNSRIGNTDVPCRQDKDGIFQAQRFASDKPRKGRCRKDSDRNHNVCHAASEDCHDGDCKNQSRKSEQDIADSHNNRINPSAVISGQKSENGTTDCTDRNSAESDCK